MGRLVVRPQPVVEGVVHVLDGVVGHMVGIVVLVVGEVVDHDGRLGGATFKRI